MCREQICGRDPEDPPTTENCRRGQIQDQSSCKGRESNSDRSLLQKAPTQRQRFTLDYSTDPQELCKGHQDTRTQELIIIICLSQSSAFRTAADMLVHWFWMAPQHNFPKKDWVSFLLQLGALVAYSIWMGCLNAKHVNVHVLPHACEPSLSVYSATSTGAALQTLRPGSHEIARNPFTNTTQSQLLFGSMNSPGVFFLVFFYFGVTWIGLGN